MDIKLKCIQKSRGNHVRFQVEPDNTRAPHELKESGAPNYGQAEFVVSDEDFEDFEEGKVYEATIDAEVAEAVKP